MIKLSEKSTGDELLASEWDNHSKELENVVTNAGISLSSNENDLMRAIDIYGKSNYYTTTNNDNTYTIDDRGLGVEELRKGMSILVEFNHANSDVVKLNYGGADINVKNANGTSLTGMRFKDNEIVPLVYNGSDFISVYYLYKYISPSNEIHELFSFYTDDNDVIKDYIEWNDEYGANPNHYLFIVRGTIVKNMVNCQLLLFTNTDNCNTADNAGSIKIDLGKFFREQFNYPLDVIWYQKPNLSIIGEDTDNSVLYSTVPLNGDIYAFSDNDNPNKLITDFGRKIWALDNASSTVHNRIRIYGSMNFHIKDV